MLPFLSRASAVVGLLVLLGLAAALARRRFTRLPGRTDLEVRSRAWLGREAGIALVRARGDLLLLGFGSEGVRLLSRVGREDVR